LSQKNFHEIQAHHKPPLYLPLAGAIGRNNDRLRGWSQTIKRPAVDPPSAFRDDATPTNNSFADLNWWQVYRDDTLQALVREAFTNNYDLRIAVTRVEQARAAAMQARAQFVPNAKYNGAVGRGRNDLFGSTFPNSAQTASSAVATLNTFWEVDLWGRVRRLNESARAQFLASEEARLHYQQTFLTAFRDVSDALVSRERLAEIRQEQAREVETLDRAVRVATDRYLAGKASYYEVLEAQQQLFPAELGLARTRLNERLALAALYKALGGGWKDTTASNPARLISTGNP
jgi:multidrug efflux system outer membrane protein